MLNSTLQFIDNFQAAQNHKANQNHQVAQYYETNRHHKANKNQADELKSKTNSSAAAEPSLESFRSLESLESVQSHKLLQSLESKALLIKVKTLVQKEKALTLQIIDYLAEISRRRAYLPKYTSLFTFLVDELGYCASTAMLRINAIRAFETVPEIRQKVLENEVSLNAVAKTQNFINQENRAAKKQEKAPMTKDEQRALFAAAEAAPMSILEEQLHKAKHEIEVRKAQAKGEVLPVLKERTQKITVELDGELQKMVEELKSLLSHTHPGADVAVLLKESLPLALRELKIARGLAKRKTALNSSSDMAGRSKKEADSDLSKDSSCINRLGSGAAMESSRSKKSDWGSAMESSRSKKPEWTSPVKPESVKNLDGTLSKKAKPKGPLKFSEARREAHPRILRRGIPSAIKQKVWSRDGGCCQHTDPQSKRQCGSRHQVQFDHIRPWSLGGDHSAENIRLLCGVHNRHRFPVNSAE